MITYSGQIKNKEEKGFVVTHPLDTAYTSPLFAKNWKQARCAKMSQTAEALKKYLDDGSEGLPLGETLGNGTGCGRNLGWQWSWKKIFNK